MNQSINRLVRAGHSLDRIGNYTLRQFTMFVDAELEMESSARVAFVTDMSAVVGSMFSSEKPSPVQQHLDLLSDVSAGVRYGREE